MTATARAMVTAARDQARYDRVDAQRWTGKGLGDTAVAQQARRRARYSSRALYDTIRGAENVRAAGRIGAAAA